VNLRGIVNSITSSINQNVTANLQRSSGSIKNADYSRTPAYSTAENITVQVQALSGDDLVQISGLNIQGEKKAIYADGSVRASSRPDGLGGDLITLPDNTSWLVVHVLEDWNGTWCKVAVKRQL